MESACFFPFKRLSLQHEDNGGDKEALPEPPQPVRPGRTGGNLCASRLHLVAGHYAART